VNITATLFGQVVTFALLVWFIQRFLWDPMTRMMEDRKKRIADGLAAAERGKHEQELAEKRATEVIHEAKTQAPRLSRRSTGPGSSCAGRWSPSRWLVPPRCSSARSTKRPTTRCSKIW
jgi:hypothetical protein